MRLVRDFVDPAARLVSDHLPVIADFVLSSNMSAEPTRMPSQTG